MHKITLTITGNPPIDGYMEMMLGIFFMTGVLLDHKATQQTLSDGRVQITLDCIMRPAPLGHLGLDDIPEVK